MTEDQLLSYVRQACKALGILLYHTHRSDRSEPGFPDLVLVGRAGVFYRELKSDRGRLTEHQTNWLANLVAAGADAAVWRCAQWPHEILAELRAMGRAPVPPPVPDARQVRTQLQKPRNTR